MKSLLLVALLTGVMACGARACTEYLTEPEPIGTGLEGRVLKGPMCPVVRDDEPCPDQPFSAWFDVFDDQNQHVTRFQTDEEGFFEVALDPGVYTLVPEASAPILRPEAQQQPVTVQPNVMTSVTLHFDTGIR